MKDVLAFVCFFVLALFNPIGAWAEDGSVGAVTALEGDMNVLKSGKERYEPVSMGYRVSIGDILTTKSNSKAEITFDDTTVIRMAPGTRLEITEYILERGERQSSVVKLTRGKIRAVVAKTKGFKRIFFPEVKKFEVQTPLAVAGVRGTDFFVFHMLGYSGVAVVKGLVWTANISMPEHIMEIREGFATLVRDDMKPPQTPKPIIELDLARHVNDTTIGKRQGDETKPSESLIDDLNDISGSKEDTGMDDREDQELPRSDEETKPPITETELPITKPRNDLPIGVP
ncbi:MAG: FecR domain-containing protein [Deltaproteobacteria bacterium]|nr:FecR domain-containing protein [Deltaproteobacteria bacterium]